jgi:predicted TIM-barrel fold metal-dependent hydrolase
LKIDCHCHVVDPERFPYRADTGYRPSGQEIAPYEHLVRVCDYHGVSHALIVGTNSGYGEDLSPVRDALARGAGRFKGIAVVANDISTAALATLKREGFVGIAFNTTLADPARYLGSGDLLERLADLDLWLQVQFKQDQLLPLLPLFERSAVRLVFDHCGRPAPSRGLGQAGFQALLALGLAGRACVKLSGLSQFSDARHPYADTHPFVQALIEAFTLERCVWGSDFPFLRAPQRIDYGPLLALIERLVPTVDGRGKLFQETPRRLFGFGVPQLPC